MYIPFIPLNLCILFFKLHVARCACSSLSKLLAVQKKKKLKLGNCVRRCKLLQLFTVRQRFAKFTAVAIGSRERTAFEPDWLQRWPVFIDLSSAAPPNAFSRRMKRFCFLSRLCCTVLSPWWVFGSENGVRERCMMGVERFLSVWAVRISCLNSIHGVAYTRRSLKQPSLSGRKLYSHIIILHRWRGLITGALAGSCPLL